MIFDKSGYPDDVIMSFNLYRKAVSTDLRKLLIDMLAKGSFSAEFYMKTLNSGNYTDNAKKRFINTTKTNPMSVYKATELNIVILNAFRSLQLKYEKTSNKQSGARLVKFIGFQVVIVFKSPVNGGTYIETPEALVAKKAIINVKNVTIATKVGEMNEAKRRSIYSLLFQYYERNRTNAEYFKQLWQNAIGAERKSLLTKLETTYYTYKTRRNYFREMLDTIRVEKVFDSDNMCFKHSIGAALIGLQLASNKNLDRPSTYINQLKKNELLASGNTSAKCETYTKFESRFVNMRFPVAISDISKFEKKNPDLAVNVFGYFSEKVEPIYRSLHLKNAMKPQSSIKIIDLLLICKLEETSGNNLGVSSDVSDVSDISNVSEEEENRLLTSSFQTGMDIGKIGDKIYPVTKHFVWIANITRLLHGLDGYGRSTHVCRNCCNYFTTAEEMEKHIDVCFDHTMRHLIMPAPGEKKGFVNWFKQWRIPEIIYSDFEAMMLEREDGAKKITQHEPIMGCLFRVSIDGVFREPVVSDCTEVGATGDALMRDYVQKLVAMGEEIGRKYKEMKIRARHHKEKPPADFEHDGLCYVCRKKLADTDELVDRNDMYTGKYLGKTHKSCDKIKQFKYMLTGETRTIKSDNGKEYSFQVRKPMIPVIFHGGKGYDFHFIIKSFNEIYGENPIVNCIPSSTEKYIGFSINNFVFIDSAQHMLGSLEDLTKKLKRQGKEYLRNTLKYFSNRKNEETKLIIKKGIFPYEYITSMSRLAETQLPPIKDFSSSIRGDLPIKAKHLERAKNVWETFGTKTIGEYCKLYMVCDVLLLSDVFEEYRNLNLKNYTLDSAHCFTSPGVAGEAMYKYTGKEVELMKDLTMWLLYVKNIRGGISQISRRFSKANHPGIPKYDPNKPLVYIVYLDVNGLYGTAMLEFLPDGNHRFLSEDEINKKFCKEDEDGHFVPDPSKILAIAKDAPIGYEMEIDVEYPEHLHDAHNDYPLFPESMFVGRDGKISKVKTAGGDQTPKLIPNLYDKENYMEHYRYIQFAIKQGLVVKKIHRVVEFTQSPWLKPYIEFNTNQRVRATSDNEKDYFKLMINAAYGKTLENKLKQTCFHLVADAKKLNKLLASPRYNGIQAIYSEKLVGVNMLQDDVVLDIPNYVGKAILGLSKLIVAMFYYEYMKPTFGDLASLLFTDTDSLAFEIRDVDPYPIFKKSSHLFDFSNFPPGHPMFDKGNKGKYGLMKDESGGNPFIEFVGQRPKLYSLLQHRIYKMDKEKKMVVKLDNPVDIKIKEKKRAKGVKNYLINKKDEKTTAVKYLEKEVDEMKKRIRHQDYKDQLIKEAKPLIRELVGFRSFDHVIQTERMTKIAISNVDTKRVIQWEKAADIGLKDEFGNATVGVRTLAHGHKSLMPIKLKVL